MLLDKANLAVSRVASYDETRQNLCGVSIEPGATIATNGHVLAVVATPDLDEKEFPVIPGQPDVDTTTLISPCLISTQSAEAISKAIPKAGRHMLPILAHAQINVPAANANGSVPVTVTDLENPVTMQVKKTEGEFPEWRSCVPQGEVKFTVAFNAGYLADLAAIAKAAGGDKGILQLEFFEETSATGPIRVTCHGAPRFAAILMPCRPN